MRWILFRSDDAGCSNPSVIIRVGEDESALSMIILHAYLQLGYSTSETVVKLPSNTEF